ncbi:MAG: TRAP transporter small permease subunit [Alphaproteobacteria bacterium]|nr:TRAP transporter small permease subunit [Alphaproteobacteria bacterium]
MAWLTLATVLLMCLNVALRYAFNVGAAWQIELVLAIHAATFLATMGYTLQAGEQVRVDVFYAGFSNRKKALVDLIGTITLLFPVCFALIYYSWGFVHSSWQLYEASSEYNGLQGIFLLKSFLLIGPALLMLQGIAVIAESAKTLTQQKALHD